MPKKKVAFIDKKSAATYQLLYRPSDDGETVGQDARMFVRTDQNWDGEHDALEDNMWGGRASNYTDDDDEQAESHERKRQELLQLGFQDDGYDYHQHLRVIGGENSMGQTVFVPTKIAKPVRLAPDRRAYDAQSLDHVPENPFEAEVRQSRARPKPAAEAGTIASELEELEAAMNSDLEEDDDWVLNDDFVHCALDTQGGAGSLSQAGPSRPQMLAPSRERTMPNTTQEDDSAEEDANDDEEEKQDQEEYSSAEYSDAEYAGAQLGGAAAAAARAPMSALDEAFERLAMDYEDDDIGGLDEYEEDVHGANDVKLYERVFDKFLDEKALDGELENGQYIAVGKATEGWNRKQEQETAEAALAKTHELGRKMQKDEAEGRRYEENLLTDHAVRDLTELWDCETIVSTYSNLDNHPGVINDEPARKQKARAAATAAAAASGPAGQIKLSRKQGLPVDYLPWKTRQDDLGTILERGDAAQAPEQEVEGDSSDEDGDAAVGSHVILERRKGETTEEKKARKAAVKQARKESRINKKANKVMLKTEGKKLASLAGPRQSVMVLT